MHELRRKLAFCSRRHLIVRHGTIVDTNFARKLSVGVGPGLEIRFICRKAEIPNSVLAARHS
jgi:hypothetical protein